MNKKIIIGIVAALVVIGGTVGTVLGVQAYNTNKEYDQLAQNVADCKRMVENINYVYFPDTENLGAQARQRDRDSIAKFENEITSKNMTEEEKSAFADFCKRIKENFEKDKNETKSQLDGMQASKDARTDEGYYSEDFNNEWNSLINQFNEKYNNEEYFNAFQVVLTMQNKLSEYVAVKTQEAADKAEAERQAQEAEKATAKIVKSGNNKTTTKDNSSKSSNKASSSYTSDSVDDSSSNESSNSNSNSNSGSNSRHEGSTRDNPNDARNSIENAMDFARSKGLSEEQIMQSFNVTR